MARRVDILLVSLDEAAALTGTRDPFRAFASLRKTGAREVVLKFGPPRLPDQRKRPPAAGSRLSPCARWTPPVLETLFVAAFLQARLRRWPTIAGAIAANAAGALATTVIGAGQNLPGQREVAALLSAQRLKGKWDESRKHVLARLQHSRSLRRRSTK